MLLRGKFQGTEAYAFPAAEHESGTPGKKKPHAPEPARWFYTPCGNLPPSGKGAAGMQDFFSLILKPDGILAEKSPLPFSPLSGSPRITLELSPLIMYCLS